MAERPQVEGDRATEFGAAIAGICWLLLAVLYAYEFAAWVFAHWGGPQLPH